MAGVHKVAIRPATGDDLPRLQALIVQSAAALSRGYYSPAEIDAAIEHVFGVDSTLIEDRTYFVAEVGGALAGCGGWSRRDKLFGGDQFEGGGAVFLDPAAAAAKIRAFFVHPAFARQGIGSAVLDACEAAARAHGFGRGELLATLPGVPFYAARGYVAGDRARYSFGDVGVDFFPMAKALAADEPPTGRD